MLCMLCSELRCYCLPACLPACIPCLPACPPACLPACPPPPPLLTRVDVNERVAVAAADAHVERLAGEMRAAA